MRQLSPQARIRHFTSDCCRRHGIALALCIALALAVHAPFLKRPHWSILDDAQRIRRDFRALDASPTVNTLMGLDKSRSRPMYWIVGYLLYRIGRGEPNIFWHANWMSLALAGFAVYGLSCLYVKRRWLAIAAPLVLMFSPPVVPVFAEVSGQESWMVLFGSGYLFFMLLTDRLIAQGKGLRHVAVPALVCWLLACPFMLVKEPAAASLAFPVGWAILSFTGSNRATWKKRLLFLGITFCTQLPWALFHIHRLRGKLHGEGRAGYLRDFAIEGPRIVESLRAYDLMLMTRVWPALVIPAVGLVISLAVVRTRRRKVVAEAIRPLLFFLGIAFIQFAVVLPWVVMTKNLFPAFVGMSVANAVALDVFYRLTTDTPYAKHY